MPALVRQAPRPAELAHICVGVVFRTEHGALTLTALALAYSHAVWAEFSGDDDTTTVPCHVLAHAWEFFGGAPRTWLFETVRPTAAMQPDVLALARGCCAVARPFTASDGVAWGEWALRCVPEQLLRRSLLRDLGQANRLLRVFADEMLRRERLGMAGRRVHELLDEERGHLRCVGTP